MSGQQQCTLTVRVEGLALWMLRDDCIDVLFPDDGLATSHDPSRHHFVTVHDGESKAQGSSDRLDRATLDFTGLATVRPHTAVNYPFGTVPLVIEPGSVASVEDAVMTGTRLVAGLRLPLGFLRSLDSVMGPFWMDNDHTMYLGYGAAWTATIAGPLDIQAAHLPYHEGETPKTWTPSWTPTSQATAPSNQTITVRCLSRFDRDVEEEIKLLEELSEVAYLGYLTRKDGAKLASVPVYHGSGTFPTKSATELMAYPKRPCPNGVGHVRQPT